MSARRISSSAVIVQLRGAMATPMLAVTNTVASPTMNGRGNTLIRSTRSQASSNVRAEPSSTTKSSPPARRRWHRSRRRSPAGARRARPAHGWRRRPSVSLMFLKRSMLIWISVAADARAPRVLEHVGDAIEEATALGVREFVAVEAAHRCCWARVGVERDVEPPDRHGDEDHGGTPRTTMSCIRRGGGRGDEHDRHGEANDQRRHQDGLMMRRPRGIVRRAPALEDVLQASRCDTAAHSRTTATTRQRCRRGLPSAVQLAGLDEARTIAPPSAAKNAVHQPSPGCGAVPRASVPAKVSSMIVIGR